MFRPLWGGTADTVGVPAGALLAAGVAAGRWRASLAACGGSESSSDANEAAGTYQVKVVTAEFPTEQRLGETSLLRLGVRNTGGKTLPALTVTISIAGKEGRDSSLPFGYPRPRSPAWPSPTGRSGCSPADYPKVDGSSEPGGAGNLEPEDLRLRPAEAGRDDRSGLEAERGQDRQLHAPLRSRRRPRRHGQGGDRARDRSRAAPSRCGSPRSPPETEVTDSGEVVEIAKDRRKPT